MQFDALRFYILVELSMSGQEISKQCSAQVAECKYIKHLMALPNYSDDAANMCDAYLKALNCIMEKGAICEEVYDNGGPMYEVMCGNLTTGAIDNLSTAIGHLGCLTNNTDHDCEKEKQSKFIDFLSKSLESEQISDENKKQLCCMANSVCLPMKDVLEICGAAAVEFEKKMTRSLFLGLFMVDCNDYTCMLKEKEVGAAPRCALGRVLPICMLIALLQKVW